MRPSFFAVGALIASVAALLPSPASAQVDGPVQAHVHGPQRGHLSCAGEERELPESHVHRPGCGHYYYDGAWHLFPSAHRHSAACGHFYYDGRWHLFPRGHVHGPGCGHFYYDGCWHLWPEGHVHGRGCGHDFVDGEWRSATRTAEPAQPVEDDREAVGIELRPFESERHRRAEVFSMRDASGDDALALELRAPPAPVPAAPRREEPVDRVIALPRARVVVVTSGLPSVRCGPDRPSGTGHARSAIVLHVCGEGCGHRRIREPYRVECPEPTRAHPTERGLYFRNGRWTPQPKLYPLPSQRIVASGGRSGR